MFEKELRELEVNDQELKEVFRQMDGTRQIIQFKGEDFTFSLSKTFEPKIRCFGVTNRCEDGQFIFFADYDKIYRSLMIQNLDNLIKKFPNAFDNFYIIKTAKEEVLYGGEIKGSYHVINFVKHSKEEIMSYISLCDVDPFFVDIPSKTAHKTHVLRISEKFFDIGGEVIKEAPKFLHIYPDKEFLLTGKECSLAHYKFFQNAWGNPTQISHEFDDSKKIELHSYLTPSKRSDKQ